jgi:GAF domain-containing protein
MRLAFLDMPDDRVDLITVARHDPEVELVLVVHPDPEALSLKIAEVLQIPHSSEPLDLLAIKPDRVALPYYDSPSAAALVRAGISERIFTTLDEVAGRLRLRAQADATGDPRPPETPWAESAPRGSRLDRIREALALSEDRQRLFREVLSLAVEQTGAESGSIMVLDESETELRIAFADGLSPDVVRTTRQPLGEGVAGRVARDGKGLVINERLADARYGEGRERPRLAAAMCAPLRLEGRVFGVLNVSSDRPGARYHDADLARLTAIADDISAILERVVRASRRDLDAVEFRARRELEDLFERGEVHAEERLRAAARVLASLLDAEIVQIHILDAKRGRFRCVSSHDAAAAADAAIGPGIVARVHERGESFFLTARLATPAEARHGEPLPNLVFVPLRGEAPLGTLVLESVRRIPEDLEEFTQRVARIAGHLARLIERQALGSEASRQGAVLGELADAAARIMMARETETLALEATAALRAIYPGCHVASRLPDAAGELKLRSAFAGPEAERDRLADAEAGISRLAMQEGQEQHSLLIGPGQRQSLEETERIRGFAAVPVRFGDEVQGTLAVVAPAPAGGGMVTPLDEIGLQGLRKLALYVSLAGDRLRGIGRRVERTLRDPDTGLLTGAGLEGRLEDEIKRSDRYREPFLLTLCALEGYDRVRRHQGERWSQDFVRELAAALRRNVREVDDVAWMGGGQFAVLSPATQKDHGVLLSRLTALLPRLENVRHLGRDEELTVVGRQVSYPDDVTTPGELLGLIRGGS